MLSAGGAQAQGFTYPFGFENPLAMSDAYEVAQQATQGGGIKVGPFKFNPGLTFNGTYTDNPRMRSGNQGSDFLFTIDPTLNFTLALSKGLKLLNYISFGYDGDLGAYTKITGNDYTRHTLWADVNLLHRDATYMRLREAVTYTDNPYGNQQFVGQGVSTPRVLNEADLVLGRQLPGNYSVELDYQNAWSNYLQNGNGYTSGSNYLEDSNGYNTWSNVVNTLNPTLLYELTGKTKLLAQYSFGFTHYYQQPSAFSADYSVQQALVGFRYAATARLSGELKGGYAWRQFVNDFNLVGSPYQNTSAPIYSLNLHYMVSPKTAADFNIYRDFDISGDLNPVSGRLDTIQDSYTRNAIGVTVTTATRPNLTFTFAASAYVDQYADTVRFQNRMDLYYNAGINFTYQLRRYLSWGLGYNFQKRDTQAVGLSYTENSVTASATLSY